MPNGRASSVPELVFYRPESCLVSRLVGTRDACGSRIGVPARSSPSTSPAIARSLQACPHSRSPSTGSPMTAS